MKLWSEKIVKLTSWQLCWVSLRRCLIYPLRLHMPVHEQSAFRYLSSACRSLPTATEDWRDPILLMISPVVHSGGRIWSIQLAAWQLLWLSRVPLAKSYFCQFTKIIWLGKGIHMVTFSNWLLKNVLRIFGKMPVFKDRTEVLYRK